MKQHVKLVEKENFLGKAEFEKMSNFVDTLHNPNIPKFIHFNISPAYQTLARRFFKERFNRHNILEI